MNVSSMTRSSNTQKINRVASMDSSKQKANSHHTETPTDKYTPSEQEKSITYKKPEHKVDQSTIDKLKAESEQHYSQLRELVRQLLERQGMTFKDVKNSEVVIKIDDKTRAEAQKAISDDGPLSPENVSDRIVNFAKALANGDKSKIKELTKAIKEGFQVAAQILGGELPEISHKTYDLVMEKLDSWANEEEVS